MKMTLQIVRTINLRFKVIDQVYLKLYEFLPSVSDSDFFEENGVEFFRFENPTLLTADAIMEDVAKYEYLKEQDLPTKQRTSLRLKMVNYAHD